MSEGLTRRVRRVPSSAHREIQDKRFGYTLVEIIIGIAIISMMASIGVPSYVGSIQVAKVAVAIGEIQQIAKAIEEYRVDHKALPKSLSDVGWSGRRDPWGNHYRYLDFKTLQESETCEIRKDRSRIQLNTDYDLYSIGKDGAYKPSITCKESRDDIIRANDGDYIGQASEY